ncbi:MAG: dephospho-CoA kinase [Gammaproteobacteria bacterium]|nr:dephospho-CoA kinase [Gammaproteobacteria bacterium]MDH3467297.1 dephospho-CoA kinase [Gammaproteobacteria bacterium]
MLRVGLTGGIGSGKTTVSDRFEELGVTVIDADRIAHKLTQAGQPAVRTIAREFGDIVLKPDGALDRDRLREIVFATPAKRQSLERILHPLIRMEMARRIRSIDGPYCVLAIPLLTETGPHPLVDHVLVVDAPEHKRRVWLKTRSGLDDEQITAIFAAQASREQRLAIADDVLVNDNDIDTLIHQVDALHQKYLGHS